VAPPTGWRNRELTVSNHKKVLITKLTLYNTKCEQLKRIAKSSIQYVPFVHNNFGLIEPKANGINVDDT